MYWYSEKGMPRHEGDLFLNATRKRIMRHQRAIPYHPTVYVYNTRFKGSPIGKVVWIGDVQYWATEKGMYELKENGMRKARRKMR